MYVERVIIIFKGRFNETRASSPKERQKFLDTQILKKVMLLYRLEAQRSQVERETAQTVI